MKTYTDDEKLMQQALKLLEYPGPSWPEAREKVAAALRARLTPAANDTARSAWRKRLIDPGY